jgi:hypothetical protein
MKESQEMKVRELLDELCRRMFGDRPPAVSTTIAIVEREGTPNWIAVSSPLGEVETELYTADVIELRRVERLVDWTGTHARGPKPRSVFKIIAPGPA